MRSSDWSSDVCSSELRDPNQAVEGGRDDEADLQRLHHELDAQAEVDAAERDEQRAAEMNEGGDRAGEAEDLHQRDRGIPLRTEQPAQDRMGEQREDDREGTADRREVGAARQVPVINGRTEERR